MKKSLLAFIVSLLVLGTTALWLFNTGGTLPVSEIVMVGAIILLAGFGLYVGFSRLKSARKGEPAEDELSRKILQKSAAYAFYVSLYLWVALIYIKDRVTVDTEVLLGSGIIAMSVVWLLFVIWFKITGLKDE